MELNEERAKIAITGVSGYLGSYLAEYLKNQNYAIIGLSRTNPDIAGIGFQPWAMSELATMPYLDGVHTLIHSAYDFNCKNSDSNVRATQHLLEQARNSKVQRFILISSMAAFEGCKSIYGKTKLKMEELVLGQGGFVVRPATIYGGSKVRGLFGSLIRMAERLPIIPVPAGESELHLIGIDKLAQGISNLVNCPTHDLPTTPITFAEITPQSLLSIVRDILKQKDLNKMTFSLPGNLLLPFLATIEALGMNSPFRSDSLRSLMNANPSPDLNSQSRYV